jgi:hypothetical protein
MLCAVLLGSAYPVPVVTGVLIRCVQLSITGYPVVGVHVHAKPTIKPAAHFSRCCCAGPSLCIALRGVSLTAAQLAQLMPARVGSVTAAAAAAAASGGVAGTGAAADAAAAVQMGLSSVWAITDVLQVRRVERLVLE